MDYAEWKASRAWWYRLSSRQQEAAVEAELTRPMTPAELDEFLAEVSDATGRPLTLIVRNR